MNVRLVFALSTYCWELTGLVASAVTLTGVWLRWRSQWHVSDIEDDIKDGKISAEVARRRMRYVELRAIALISIGLLALIVAVIGAVIL